MMHNEHDVASLVKRIHLCEDALRNRHRPAHRADPQEGLRITVPATSSGTLNRRQRQRAATVEEIKEVARGLMREQGTTDVRFTDIAKEMGMTPPALYRYYADRDALLTELIADAYRDLGQTVAQARDRHDADDVAGLWVAAGRAYRDWARREPRSSSR